MTCPWRWLSAMEMALLRVSVGTGSGSESGWFLPGEEKQKHTARRSLRTDAHSGTSPGSRVELSGPERSSR